MKPHEPARDGGHDDPGLDRPDWESEWQALEDGLRASPARALSELDRLVARMLEESGYDLTDPVVRQGAGHDARAAADPELDARKRKTPDGPTPGAWLRWWR